MRLLGHIIGGVLASSMRKRSAGIPLYMFAIWANTPIAFGPRIVDLIMVFEEVTTRHLRAVR